jgi:hypothetical protein
MSTICTQEAVHPEPCSYQVEQSKNFQKIHDASRVTRFDSNCNTRAVPGEDETRAFLCRSSNSGLMKYRMIDKSRSSENTTRYGLDLFLDESGTS